MSGTEPPFEWYDAWILCALLAAIEGEAPVPLWRLIAVADGINKAIVSRGELEVGIGRLVAAGYVRASAEGFEATPKALAITTQPGGHWMDQIEEAIGAKEWAPGLGMPRTTAETYVTSDAYSRALKKYHKEFSRKHKES